ncbi:hypothetical protein L207DRAFT_571488 [Hyaloscypha variabilis F]|uniref:Uncharacterized protein n=1 Tax=Hyaloscypha variabilis (strain UAMH 11265 / GT02V1 / F) TaxID=1149755 RepID=A0A2J6R431_HYAVF|nr:hypothetical protein L207DRAFT_571488 [Hyaloscypha variabilis F]
MSGHNQELILLVSSTTRERPNAKRQTACHRARLLIRGIRQYQAAIAADPTLIARMEQALVDRVNAVYEAAAPGAIVYGAGEEGARAALLAGGLSITLLDEAGGAGRAGGGVEGVRAGAGAVSGGGFAVVERGGGSAGPSVRREDRIIIPAFFPSVGAAVRPALVQHLGGPRHMYVAFVRAFAAANYPGVDASVVLGCLREEFSNLNLPDLD